MTPPTLVTPRLLLTPHRAEDLDALAAIWADPNVVRHISGKPSSRQESWFRMLGFAGLWPILGYGYWAVREKSSGRFMGDVGFADFARPIEPSIAGIPEAGWVLASWAHGQGFATEALSAALAWLDQHHIDQSVCLINKDNQASLRVAEKTGYIKTADVTAGLEDTVLLTRNKP